MRVEVHTIFSFITQSEWKIKIEKPGLHYLTLLVPVWIFRHFCWKQVHKFNRYPVFVWVGSLDKTKFTGIVKLSKRPWVALHQCLSTVLAIKIDCKKKIGQNTGAKCFYARYSLNAFKWHKSNIKNLLMKSSDLVFILLPAFYLIIWLMISPKNFEKISILKIWQLVFF